MRPGEARPGGSGAASSDATDAASSDATEAFRERLADARARGTPLCIRGAGTKDWYGRTPCGEGFDTREHRGIVAYDPAELVITARCGTPLADIEQALAAAHQCLPFEPPHFGAGATLGGTIAAGLAGPRRAYAGAARDFVLGAVLMDGEGRTLRFGGQVMKNVAGYDVARLLAGSLGVLGLILEVSIKVLPRPAAETTLCFELDHADAIERMNRWAGRPLPLSASVWHAGVLSVRLSGASAAVEAARKALGGERLADEAAERFWTSVREQRHPFFTGSMSSALWRLAVPSAVAPLPLAEPPFIEWGGGQRWYATDAPAETLRRVAAQVGGHVTLFRGADRDGEVFTPLPQPLMDMHRRLKAAFDPAGLFNRGRMYSDL